MNSTNNSSTLVAKICGNTKLRKIAYLLHEIGSLIFLERKDILLFEMEACEKLLKYTKNQVEREAIDKELSKGSPLRHTHIELDSSNHSA